MVRDTGVNDSSSGCQSAQKLGARKAALGKAGFYVYLHYRRTPMLDDRPGTFHACEIAVTFNNAVRPI
jgi:hypothetical protein